LKAQRVAETDFQALKRCIESLGQASITLINGERDIEIPSRVMKILFQTFTREGFF